MTCNLLQNNKRHRLNKRRALASVVTSAIVLSAVSIMGVMLLGWSQTSIANQKQEINDVYDTRMNKINEELLYENIWFATPGGIMIANHLNVTVANIGILGLNVTSIQVTNVTGTNNTSFISSYTDGGIAKSNSLSFNATYAWQSADELEILIFTDRGNQFVTQVVVP
jgi:hypothetical protein